MKEKPSRFTLAPARPRSIAGRLLAFSAIFVSLALVVASAVLWLALQSVVREQIDQRLDTQIGALANAVTRDENGKIVLSAPSLDGPPFDRSGSGWYWQIDGGQSRLTSRSLSGRSIDAPPPRQDFVHLLTFRPASGEGRSGSQTLYLRQALYVVDGANLTITATAPRAVLFDPAIRALTWLAPSMLVLGAVLLLGTFWQIRFGLKPLKAMAAGIDAINRGERRRLADEETLELSALTLKVNALLQSNEERLAATRLQFANLAHGLKTPVASLLLALDERNDPDRILKSLAERIDQRIKHHLGAARRVMGSNAGAATTVVAPCVGDLHRAVGMIYADRKIDFGLDVPADLTVACDQADVEEMVGNLLDNAFKWAASSVFVTARLGAGFVEIVVEDDGSGIRPDRLAAVLLPGVREDEQVPGNGLGLAIVTELAGLYGGSLRLQSRSPTGLNAILSLPAAMRGDRSQG